MSKKVISVILAAALALMLAVLAGCGSGEVEEADLAVDVGGAITVSAYDTMTYRSFLEYAAQKFEEKYPGTTVTVETVGSMPEIRTQESGDSMRMTMIQSTDDQQAEDDYIRKINTELMSGKGADVIALDILPYYKYADNGQLVDLSGYMQNDSDFHTADYAANIFEGAKYRGGQYLFPINYTFSWFAYDSSLDPSFPSKDKLTYAGIIEAEADKARDSGAKIFGLAAFAGTGRSHDMFSAMLDQSYEQYVDMTNKKANFTNGSFAELLTTVQSYADKGYIEPYSVLENRNEGTFSPAAFTETQQQKYYAKKNENFSLINQFTRDLGMSMVIRIGGAGSGDTSNDEIAGLVANEKGDVQYSYSMGFGINSNSANKRTAWEFVKFLAGEEIQSSGLTPPQAIPVNKEARDTLASMNITGEAMMRRAEAINSGGGNVSGVRSGRNSEGSPEGDPEGGSEPRLEAGSPGQPPNPRISMREDAASDPEGGIDIQIATGPDGSFVADPEGSSGSGFRVYLEDDPEENREPDPQNDPSNPQGNPERRPRSEAAPGSGPRLEADPGLATGTLTAEQQNALDNYLQTIDKFTAQLNKLVIRDGKIDAMITTEAGYFFTGEKSAEEAANSLQSQVNLYLNE